MHQTNSISSFRKLTQSKSECAKYSQTKTDDDFSCIHKRKISYACAVLEATQKIILNEFVCELFSLGRKRKMRFSCVSSSSSSVLVSSSPAIALFLPLRFSRNSQLSKRLNADENVTGKLRVRV